MAYPASGAVFCQRLVGVSDSQAISCQLLVGVFDGRAISCQHLVGVFDSRAGVVFKKRLKQPTV